MRLEARKYLFDIDIRLDDTDRGRAEAQVREMCEKLLANPVIERYTFDQEPA